MKDDGSALVAKYRRNADNNNIDFEDYQDDTVFTDEAEVTFQGSIAESGSLQGSLEGSLGSIFNTAKVGYTPRLKNKEVNYKNPDQRAADNVAPDSSLSRPNGEDNIRRVSVVMHQHIMKCEARLANATAETLETGLFHVSKMKKFSEEQYISPKYVYHFVRAPIIKSGFLYSIRQETSKPPIPTVAEIHKFLSDLFILAKLSAECSIVCLIYVERLMELGNVPLLACTWRPCVLCGLLLATKVWQDHGLWNIEFAEIYPQFALKAINKLEKNFCQEIQWDLYISSSVYAKYYFALRSMTENQDFRRKYNTMMVNAPGASQIEIKSQDMKDSVLQTTLSKSL